MSEIITAAAERRGFTQRLLLALKRANCPAHAHEIAERCNRAMPRAAITKHAVAKWLRGEAMPTQDRLRALSAALGVTSEWLRFGHENGNGHGGYPISNPSHALAVDLSLMSNCEVELVRELVQLLLQKQRKESRI